MSERAAHLVDHVFPDVPVRRWVLSVPYIIVAGHATAPLKSSQLSDYAAFVQLLVDHARRNRP